MAEIPLKITVKKRERLNQYYGIVGFGDKEIHYSAIYGKKKENGMVDSTIIWSNPKGTFTREAFKKLYDEICYPFNDIIRQCVCGYEKTKNTPGRQESSLEFNRKFNASKNIEDILNNLSGGENA